ncbi:MAG TPA: NUDIX hydrolase [Adhaeribacter sp.]|nr:NUDIX hydrolase [Adhaeribacter sp.]
MPEITDQTSANQTNTIINQALHHQLRVRVCGICVQQNTLLLVRHRGIVPGKDFWAPPGGGLIFGETILGCLKREFTEETGLQIDPGRFLFLNEFLRPPLHALELFFETRITSGSLKQGSDPEFPSNAQLIQEVAFKTLSEINAIPYQEKHQILYELVNLDDLFIPENRFVKK